MKDVLVTVDPDWGQAGKPHNHMRLVVRCEDHEYRRTEIIELLEDLAASGNRLAKLMYRICMEFPHRDVNGIPKCVMVKPVEVIEL